MRVGQADVGLCRYEQGGGRPALGPLLAALVERVVDPGERPGARELVERLELPVSCAEPGAAAESQHREVGGQAQQQRQVVVGALLPARGPDQLVVLGQPQQAGAGAVGDAVRDPVDQVEPAGDVRQRPVEAEQADHAVDVDCQYRSLAHATEASRLRARRRTHGAAPEVRYHHAPCHRRIS